MLMLETAGDGELHRPIDDSVCSRGMAKHGMAWQMWLPYYIG